MYWARRGQRERKGRAARQRTLAPTGKHSEKGADAQAEQSFAAPGMEAKTAAPSATWGPTAAGPGPAPPPQAEMTWDVGPALAPPAAPAPPPFAPSAPAYSPPAPPPPPAPEEDCVPAPVHPIATPPDPLNPI